MIHACYGSDCPYERSDGGCKKPHYIDKCPSDMTDKEFEWFSGVFDEFETTLFNPQVEHNWCGIVSVRIEYVDENGNIHKCEVV